MVSPPRDNLNLVDTNLDGIQFLEQLVANSGRASEIVASIASRISKRAFLAGEALCQDFCSNPLDLDIHLKGCDPVTSSTTLKSISQSGLQTLGYRSILYSCSI